MHCPDSHPLGTCTTLKTNKEPTQGNPMAKAGSVIEGYDEKHLCCDRWGMADGPELLE